MLFFSCPKNNRFPQSNQTFIFFAFDWLNPFLCLFVLLVLK